MCIIIVCPPGKSPDEDTLLQATWENADGSGWVIKAPHGLEVVRSAKSIDHVVSTFLAARSIWPDSWAVWHSRLATHGYVDDVNTHPFRVPGTDWALVHNGILPLTDGPWRDDRSDSRILAEDYIGQKSWAELKAGAPEFEKWLQGDKVVLLSGKREKGGPILIFNEGRGTWDKENGCWYSHPLHYWQYQSKYRSTPAAIAKVLDDEDGIEWDDPEDAELVEYLAPGDQCPDCLGRLIDAEVSGMDAVVCADCGEFWENDPPRETDPNAYDYPSELEISEMTDDDLDKFYKSLALAESDAAFSRTYNESMKGI